MFTRRVLFDGLPANVSNHDAFIYEGNIVYIVSTVAFTKLVFAVYGT
ncbi:hypothetical protein Q0F98_35310 [Paenibacillus amylolyticus]|nr:hypothetical protein Q0F98_35310 [Paenibacillus amylolyticus]